MGFARYEAGKRKVGWLVNLKPTELEDEKYPGGRSALDMYFLQDDGGSFKATLEYEPYFLVAVKRGYEAEAEEWLKRVPGGGCVKSVAKVDKEDLKMPNHLLGYRRTFLRLNFVNQADLMGCRRDVLPIAEKNKKNLTALDAYAEVARYVQCEQRRRMGVGRIWLLTRTARMRVSICLMTIHEVMRDDLMARLRMRAISLSTLGNGMFPIMCEY